MRFAIRLSIIIILAAVSPVKAMIFISGFANSIIGPVTITQPGKYQLSFDIAGPIIIDADNVEIDLNNRTISSGTNCISATNHQNISIHNGIVQNASMQAVSFDGCRNIEIDRIDFLSNAIGLFVTNCTGITVAANVFSENTGNALVIENSSNVELNAGEFFQNTTPQIVLLDNVTSVFAKKLNFTSNNTNDLDVITINDSNNLVFKQINMSQNNANADNFFGWNITNAQNVVLHKCNCSNNSGNDNLAGISISSGQNILCEKVTINNNTSGVEGIRVVVSSDIVIKNSTINGNSSAVQCSGINLIASEKIIIHTVSISNNNATNDFTGILSTNNTTDSCFINCLIKANTAGSVAIGISFAASVMRCFVLNNIIKDNSNFGIFNDGSINSIFGNIAQNNGTNYGGSTGIPTSITSMYTVATGMFSGGTMTILDNISG